MDILRTGSTSRWSRMGRVTGRVRDRAFPCATAVIILTKAGTRSCDVLRSSVPVAGGCCAGPRWADGCTSHRAAATNWQAETHRSCKQAPKRLPTSLAVSGPIQISNRHQSIDSVSPGQRHCCNSWRRCEILEVSRGGLDKRRQLDFAEAKVHFCAGVRSKRSKKTHVT